MRSSKLPLVVDPRDRGEPLPAEDRVVDSSVTVSSKGINLREIWNSKNFSMALSKVGCDDNNNNGESSCSQSSL